MSNCILNVGPNPLGNPRCIKATLHTLQNMEVMNLRFPPNSNDLQYFEWGANRRWAILCGDPFVTRWESYEIYFRNAKLVGLVARYTEYRQTIRAYCLSKKRVIHRDVYGKWFRLLALLVALLKLKEKLPLLKKVRRYLGRHSLP